MSLGMGHRIFASHMPMKLDIQNWWYIRDDMTVESLRNQVNMNMPVHLQVIGSESVARKVMVYKMVVAQ